MKGESRLLNWEVSELDMSSETSELSCNDHPEVEEVIEEERKSTTDPPSPSKQIGFKDTSTDIPH